MFGFISRAMSSFSFTNHEHSLSQPPQSKRANFDATHELEEILLEDNPLRAKPRKQNKYDPSRYDGLEPAVARDLRVMEEKFAVFDYTKPKVMAQVNNASSPTMSMSTGSTVLN